MAIIYIIDNSLCKRICRIYIKGENMKNEKKQNKKASDLIPKMTCYGIICILVIGVFSGLSVSDTETFEMQKGSIIMFNGTTNDFDGWGYLKNNTDWHMCNGYNDTVDLQGQFIVGYNKSHNDYDEILETGGEQAHALTEDELAYHEHGYSDTYHRTISINQGTSTIEIVADDRITFTLSTTNGVGKGTAHENRPPFTVLFHIQKIK